MVSIIWSKDEVDYLREGFMKGDSMKKMAAFLKRSPGAVNKALSRFHIRTPRIFKERETRFTTHPRSKYYMERDHEHHIRASIRWKNMKDVVEWLQKMGDVVQFVADGEFLINRHPKTNLQLLMYANQKRLQQGEEIFMVENVTW